MIIGILTQPLTNNYGGILQNYAIQQLLIQLGHEPVTIRIAHGWQNMSLSHFLRIYPKYIIFHLLQKIKGNTSHLPEPIWKWQKNVSGIEEFIKNHIRTTRFVSGKSLSFDIIKEYSIDLLVVGSDQVWHGGFPYMNNVYFCGFAKNNNIKRISYAASFGFDCWRGTEEQTTEAKELIKKFHAIGVREKNGVELCREVLGRGDAEWVLDPTMLVDKSNYNNLCKDIPRSKEKFIFAYILDDTKEKQQLVEYFSLKYGYAVHRLGVEKTKKSDRIEEWLANFRDAEYVVTDSYHGTVFSLIYKKEFYCFYNSSRGNSRMDSLKELTGIESRIKKSFNVLDDERINYQEIDKRILEMRNKSMRFLRNALIE